MTGRYQLTADRLVGGWLLTAESVALFLHLPPEKGAALVRRGGFPAPATNIDGADHWNISEVTQWSQHHVFADPAAQATCLYRHFSKTGALLYVGVSLCTLQRQSQHKNGAEWFKEIATITVEWFDTRAEAEAAETRAIKAESPQHNIQQATGLRKRR